MLYGGHLTCIPSLGIKPLWTGPILDEFMDRNAWCNDVFFVFLLRWSRRVKIAQVLLGETLVRGGIRQVRGFDVGQNDVRWWKLMRQGIIRRKSVPIASLLDPLSLCCRGKEPPVDGVQP